MRVPEHSLVDTRYPVKTQLSDKSLICQSNIKLAVVSSLHHTTLQSWNNSLPKTIIANLRRQALDSKKFWLASYTLNMVGYLVCCSSHTFIKSKTKTRSCAIIWRHTVQGWSYCQITNSPRLFSDHRMNSFGEKRTEVMQTLLSMIEPTENKKGCLSLDLNSSGFPKG